MTRKIDMMVATEVFGIVRLEDTTRFLGIRNVWIKDEYLLYFESPRYKYEAELPRYSTDIAEAWGVVSHVREYLDCHIWLESFSRTYCFDFGYACIGNAHEVAGRGRASTMPLAICKAALKAKGVSQQLIDEAMK